MESMNNEGFKIEEVVFHQGGTYASYPRIVSGADSGKLDRWNNIIREDMNKILKIYSAYTFTSPPGEQEIFLPDNLRINYEIKLNDKNYLSIFYKADFFSPYAAYPTQLVYTTNIDMKNDRRLRLSDITDVNQALVDSFTSWEIVDRDHDYDNYEEYSQAVNDYIAGLGKEILWMGFQAADIIGHDNYLEIYSYLTPDRIGISISVPHYIGDHVEYEGPR